MFAANAAGGKETPIIIGKAASPRCFKGLRDKSKPLGISYFSNSKAWMTSEIFETVLSRLNRRLARQRRNILPLMNNATCHPEDMSDKLSHIKVVFLPKNTTSRLQPLDAGIIKNFKCHYQKLLIKHIIANIDSDSSTTASEIAQTINLLKVIEWVKQAWDQVESSSIYSVAVEFGHTY